MKKLFTLSLLLLSFVIIGQTRNKKADQLFEGMRYKDAAKEYEKAFKKGDKSLELAQQAGDSYYFNSDMTNATRWYNRLFTEHKVDSIQSKYAFRFIHTLKGTSKYEKAKKMIEFFADSDIINPIQVAQLNKNNKPLVDELFALEPSFNVFPQRNINSKYSDFGPMFYKNEVVFASSRDTMDLETREYHWNKQSFLDLYQAKSKLNKGRFTDKGFAEAETYNHLQLFNVREFSNTLNTRYHEASISFSPDEKTIYFTRNNYKEDESGKLKRAEDGINHLKLYRARYVKNENVRKRDNDSIWSHVEELPFNNESYSVGHPAVSKDGSTLYFVSDMPGGIGATDIYKVSINNEGSFGSPENLGPTINTAGREMYPYESQTRFYFSSDGHLGLGALDVFETVKDENGVFSEPGNLGKPLNSQMDDFGFILDEDTQAGYFSSNRKGGKGDDDIYSFVRDKVAAKKPAKVLAPCTQIANGTVINKINKKTIPNATVKLFGKENALLETVYSDANGVFIFTTPLLCESQYTANASKEQYGEESKVFETSTELGLELGLAIEVDPIIDLIYIDRELKKFRIENLNFDLNKANIRPDAAAELNKIIAVMTEYPSILIKIEAHTDARGSDAYNEKLSDKRAKSTMAYMVSNGIDAVRIESAIGYGEKRLLNECVNGVRCSNDKHDVNRRSDFIITKM